MPRSRWQQWKDRQTGKVQPLPVCACGTKLIRKSTQERGTCGSCHRKTTTNDRVKKHRAKPINLLVNATAASEIKFGRRDRISLDEYYGKDRVSC